jgi:hypothetical protein
VNGIVKLVVLLVAALAIAACKPAAAARSRQ